MFKTHYRALEIPKEYLKNSKISYYLLQHMMVLRRASISVYMGKGVN